MKKHIIRCILILSAFLILNIPSIFAASLPSLPNIPDDPQPVCDHSSQKTNVVQDVKQIANDNEYHLTTETYDEICVKCDEVLKTKIYNEKKEKHSFKNDVCEECKYTKKCNHTVLNDVEVEKPEYTSLDNDETNHKVTKFIRKQCASCKEYTSEITNVESNESHTFKDNKCIHCNFELKLQKCLHEDQSMIDISETKKVQIIEGNDTEHTVITEKKSKCKKCGLLLDDTSTTEEQEPHEFSNDICEKCGYVKILPDSELDKAIQFMNDNGIMIGNENGDFNPNSYIKRSEYAKVVCEFIGNDMDTSNLGDNFSDVSSEHWAYEYIQKANKAGLLRGYGNNIFGINDTLTEEQAITVLCRMLGNTYEDVSYIETNVDEKGGYSDGYISVAGERGISINGINKSLPATRAKIAKWLYQLYNIKNKA